MARRRIGSVVVVSDDHPPIAILTDRDVAVRVVAVGLDVETTPVEHVTSRDLTLLPTNASFEQVTEMMRDRGVRRIPLVDER